ncbi:hypothetical protein GOV03_04065 [Candidatus Woesearchaeota archaeon]|nr:hypothetical protein [Candidatus Woesearchaeota archaeon]
MLKMKKLLLIIPLLIILFFSFISLGENHIPASLFSSPELFSPSDWISENQIKIYSNKVTIELENPTWASFTNTNSMDPFLDETANAIEISPESPEEINPGDVISYRTRYGVIIHRVIEKGEDGKGVYFLVKGDNNSFKDPFKVRFDDIEGVLVAIIY